ncbi:hypothetical protein HGRIS_000992 [Hohenbuehelia grisea]|uniref:Uncharacterized protein n=1 Tax=Hohenbuehelia grisea TaxID=104357 RepID=A0ABR3IQD9_9AGAR
MSQNPATPFYYSPTSPRYQSGSPFTNPRNFNLQYMPASRSPFLMGRQAATPSPTAPTLLTAPARITPSQPLREKLTYMSRHGLRTKTGSIADLAPMTATEASVRGLVPAVPSLKRKAYSSLEEATKEKKQARLGGSDFHCPHFRCVTGPPVVTDKHFTIYKMSSGTEFPLIHKTFHEQFPIIHHERCTFRNRHSALCQSLDSQESSKARADFLAKYKLDLYSHPPPLTSWARYFDAEWDLRAGNQTIKFRSGEYAGISVAEALLGRAKVEGCDLPVLPKSLAWCHFVHIYFHWPGRRPTHSACGRLYIRCDHGEMTRETFVLYICMWLACYLLEEPETSSKSPVDPYVLLNSLRLMDFTWKQKFQEKDDEYQGEYDSLAIYATFTEVTGASSSRWEEVPKTKARSTISPRFTYFPQSSTGSRTNKYKPKLRRTYSSTPSWE